MTPTNETPESGAARRTAIRGLVWPALATLAGLSLLVALGVWQLQRRTWKLDLIERMESRALAAPLPFDRAMETALRSGPGDIEYRKVTLRGHFEHAQERHLYGLLDGAPGWRVITPLRTPEGVLVLIDRGFVPMALKDPATRLAGQIAGEVETTGAARAPGTKDWLGPDNDPRRNQWHWRDLEGMAAGVARTVGETGGKTDGLAPFFVEAETPPAPGGWPKSGPAHVTLPNRHLEYALTWFGLAATLATVFGIFAWGRVCRKTDIQEPVRPPIQSSFH